MIATEVQFYENISFEDYLKLPGISFSGIKALERGTPAPSPKIKLGTDVHTYLLTPELYKHDNIRIIKPLALELKNTLGSLFKHLKKELSVTANFCHEGFKLAYKGRLDLCIPNRLVIDIKVTEEDIQKTIDYFGYTHQQSGYATGINARTILILAINPKTLKTRMVSLGLYQEWWNTQIVKRGDVII